MVVTTTRCPSTSRIQNRSVVGTGPERSFATSAGLPERVSAGLEVKSLACAEFEVQAGVAAKGDGDGLGGVGSLLRDQSLRQILDGWPHSRRWCRGVARVVEDGPGPLPPVTSSAGLRLPGVRLAVHRWAGVLKGRLVQYAGRVLRAYPGKQTAEVHDYHDIETPVLSAAVAKRAPGYVSLDFPDPRRM